MELSVANNEYVIFSINRSSKQNINYFLDRLLEGPYFYLEQNKNIRIIGNFNATHSNPHLILFLENQNLNHLIKNLTCMKSSNESAIDLILTYITIFIKKVNILKLELIATI